MDFRGIWEFSEISSITSELIIKSYSKPVKNNSSSSKGCLQQISSFEIKCPFGIFLVEQIDT